jgi:uncharacterized protein (TIGR03083 family)
MEALAVHVTLIQAEAERLAQYLATVPPDAWRQPSACQGWEVRDVVAHLVEVAQSYVRTISRGVQGDMARPPELASPAIARAAFIAQSAIACRERLGEALLPTFRTRYAELSALLAQLSGGDWEKLCYYTSEPRSRPVREFLALSVQELAIHGWDIRSRLEPAFHLSPESVAVLVQHTSRRLGRAPSCCLSPPSRVLWPAALSLGAARSSGRYSRYRGGARALSHGTCRYLGGAGHLPRRGGNVCSAAVSAPAPNGGYSHGQSGG